MVTKVTMVTEGSLEIINPVNRYVETSRNESVRYFCMILNRTGMCRQILVKYLGTKVYQNPD
jgi:hypothetical protein